MEDIKVDNKAKINERFDLKNELSTLVEKKVISRRIADRLEEKLNEKKVNINKEQLQSLVKKICEIIKTYSKNEKYQNKNDMIIKAEKTIEKKSNDDINILIETVEKIQQKLSIIETNLFNNEEKRSTSLPKIVTTDDINIPITDEKTFKEFKLEPLTEIPNTTESIIVIMKWLQYLIDKCGHSNLSTILDYYIDVGWISQDAKLILIDYSNGITEDNNKRDIIKREIIDLPSKDHIQSLFFIQKLKGKEVDKHLIDKIDGELNRITKKIDNYYFNSTSEFR